MRAIVFLVTCLAILITTSCGDKAVEPIQPPDIETQLIGDWFLHESCGGIDGECTVPYNSDGVSFTTEGIFHQWCNVCYSSPLDYKIVQKISYFYGPDTLVTAIVFTHESMTIGDLIIKHLDDSALIVQGDCADCSESTYSRFRITDPIIVDPGGGGP